jgi:hypothetical protein
MAKIRLDERDCRKNVLPPVCMVCGEEATEYKRKKFAWEPAWVYVFILLGLLGLIIAAILLSVMRKTMTVYCPLCDRHQSHWLRKAAWTWGLLGAWLFGLVVLIVIGGNIAGNAHVGPFAAGGIVFTLVIFVAVGLISTRGIRPREITDREITLVGLHEDFVTSAEEELGFEERRPRRRRRQDDDEDSDRPRPRKDDGYTVVDDPDDRPRRRRIRDEADD